MKAYIEKLIDYNYWANGLVMKNAEKLTDEEFRQENGSGLDSVRDILAHVMLAEWLWLERMQGKSRILDEFKKFFKLERYPTIKECYDDWFDIELRMRDFLANMPEEQLTQTFEYARSDGSEYENRYIDIFTQLILHGMQHRSELAVILSKLGHSPGNLDYIVYLRS
jgi:uncharacterized damage-inducible protein DinB